MTDSWDTIADRYAELLRAGSATRQPQRAGLPPFLAIHAHRA